LLHWRLILGTLIVAALAGLCWLDWHAARPGIYLLPLALVLAWLAAGELLGFCSDRPRPPLAWPVYVGAVVTVAASAVPLLFSLPADCALGQLGWPMCGLALGLLLAVGGEMGRYREPGGVTENIGLSVFAIVYVGLLLGFAVQLRILPGGNLGLVALLSMIAVVKMGDVGAYAVGRLVGRHKMTPRLSPGKTWEGAAGAVAFACLASYLVFHRWLPTTSLAASGKAPAWGWLAYAVVLAATGIIGDLAVSLLKRDAGRKDSSTWMPGFGGVLDILDSPLAAAPVAYVCWLIGLVG